MPTYTENGDMILDQTGPLAPIDRPWQLIRDAIDDLELQERRGLNAPLFTDASPYQYERNVAMRLMALNSFRVGAIWEAYDRLDIDQPETLPRNVTITHYKIDKNLFKSQMRQLADRIETAHKVQAKLDLFEQIKNLMD
jgi:hypothetical protein